MKRVIWFVCFVLSLTGCNHAVDARSSDTTPAKQSEVKHLVDREDVILVKHFYAQSGFSEDQSTYDSIVPGYLSLGAVWFYQPDKQGDGKKGLRIVLTPTHVSLGSGGSIRQETGYLDEDEMRDLDTAITYFLDRSRGAPIDGSGDHVELSFMSRDGLKASYFNDKTGKATLHFGQGAADVYLPVDEGIKLRDSLRTALTLLDSKH